VVSGKTTRLNSSDETRKASYRPRQIRLVTWAACGTRIAVIVRSCLDPVPGLLRVLPMQVNANFNNYCLLLQAPQRIQDMLHRLALVSKGDAKADSRHPGLKTRR